MRSTTSILTSSLTSAFLAGNVLLASPLSAADEEAVSRPPNVLFYLVDTCRADRMGLFGHQRETTPFLSKLAERGVAFERCYSQAPWTKPSMASILTSRPPSEHGMVRLFARLPDSFETAPERIREAGWFTAGFSANPIMGRMSNYTQGFQWFVESIQVNGGDPIDLASGSAAKLNEHVFSWLDEREPDDAPIFLYVHSVDPHEEYEPTEPYLSTFADVTRMETYREDWKKLLATRPPLPGNCVTQSNFDRAEVDATSFIAHGRDLYDADILANDREIERLYSRLQEAWGDDFIFVITADHGEEFFEHGATSHGYSLYGEMIHVPLMIVAPGRLPTGLRVRSPVRSMDVFPTVLDLMGIDPPTGIAGRSLAPLAHAPRTWKDEPVFSEKIGDESLRAMKLAHGIAISTYRGRWKFVLNTRSSDLFELPRHELYDLSTDSLEQANVAAEHPDLVKEFEDSALRWSATHVARGAASEDIDPDDLPAEMIDQLRALGYLK